MIRDCAGKIIEDEEALAVTSGLITKALTLLSMILTSKNEQLLMWIGIRASNKEECHATVATESQLYAALLWPG